MKPLSDEELDNVIDYMESHDMVTVEDGKRLIATIRERDKRIAELQAKVVDCDMAYAEGQLSAVDDAALRSHDDIRRAEALILYNSFIARGWGDGDKAAFASRAEAAIEAAAVFNEKWEERADASPKPWSEEDIKAVVEPNDSMVNNLIELKDQRDEARNELDDMTHNRELAVKECERLRAELEAAKTKIRFQEIDLDCARKERDTGYSMADAANSRIDELEAYKARVEALPVRRYARVRLEEIPGYVRDIHDKPVRGRFIPAEGE